MAETVVVQYLNEQCKLCRAAEKKRKACQLVKRMFGDAAWEAGQKRLHPSPRQEPHPEQLWPVRATFNSLFAQHSFSSQIWGFLLLCDSEKLAQCSNSLHSLVKIRVVVNHALSARCANARSLDTAAAAQQLQLDLEPVIKRLSADLGNRCLSANALCNQALFEIQQLVASPPPVLEAKYMKYMRGQQPPTQLQVALFVDFIFSWGNTPVCVFLSPTAGMRKNTLSGKWEQQADCEQNRRISTDQYRARYGLLDYILSKEVPVTVETPEGKLMAIPPGVASIQNSRIRWDERSAAYRQICKQVEAIYGTVFE
mmetsp:Transcript_41449/g.72798  ORF Transcript_41449/g.72798 Transcript_41449/m.72798 type:complete len:312 (-) Transcript_41449:57-992(-)